MLDRRRFLFGAGAAVLAAPTLSTLRMPDLSALDPLNSLSGTKPYPVNRTLDRLLRESHAGNPFVARADTRVKVSSMRLMPAPEALESIFDSLRLSWSFSDHVCYCNASQCTDQFSSHEQRLRRRYNAFAGVKRSPEDNDIAYLAARNSDESDVAAATQFGGYDAAGLSGDDPGVIRAASDLLKKDYQPSSREIARSFAVTNIEDWPKDKEEAFGRRYETPVLSIVHDWRARRDAPQGVLIVRNNQRDDDIVYFGGLYA